MSWVSIVNACILGVVVYSLFMWSGGGYLVYGSAGGVCVLYLVKELFLNKKHFVIAFFTFLLAETAVFITLFYLVLSSLPSESVVFVPLSEWSTLPLLGSAFLFGSSVLMSTYHAHIGLRSSNLWYLSGVFLGSLFVLLQYFELNATGFSMVTFDYAVACLMTVGFHFFHVMAGLIVLIIVYFLLDSVSDFYLDCAVWYWHYVDAMWLFVFCCVYVAR